jgi:hypothetical protein
VWASTELKQIAPESFITESIKAKSLPAFFHHTLCIGTDLIVETPSFRFFGL